MGSYTWCTLLFLSPVEGNILPLGYLLRPLYIQNFTMPRTGGRVCTERGKRRRVEKSTTNHDGYPPEESGSSASITYSATTSHPVLEARQSIPGETYTTGAQRIILASRDSGYSSAGVRATESDWDQIPSKVTGADRIRQPEESSMVDWEDDEVDPETSEFSPPMPGKAPAAMEVDDGIIKEIKKKLTATDLKDEFGIPYTLLIDRGQSSKTIIKVGSTQDTVMKRMGNIAGKHTTWKYKAAHGMDKTPMRCYHKAERLAQKELAHFLERTKCFCGTKVHREYFVGLDAAVGIAAVNRWRRFCAAEPYEENGTLKPFWALRLQEGRFLAAKTEAAGDYVRCAQRWEQFVDATSLDHLHYRVGRLIDALGSPSLVWRLCNLAQALLYLISPHIITWVVSWLVVGYACYVCTLAVGREAWRVARGREAWHVARGREAWRVARSFFKLENGEGISGAGEEFKTPSFLSPRFVAMVPGASPSPPGYLRDSRYILKQWPWWMKLDLLWEGLLRAFKAGQGYFPPSLRPSAKEDDR